MQVHINGEVRELIRPTDVAALVREVLHRDDAVGVAVALNGEVVGRTHWRERLLAEGDEVEILEASAGG